MAFSAVQGAANQGTSTTWSATFPATPTLGNLLVGVISTVQTNATLAVPSGWTALTNAATSGSGGSMRMFWKIAGASEPTVVSQSGALVGWSMMIEEYATGGATVTRQTDNAAYVTGTAAKTTPSVTPTAGSTPALIVCAAMVAAGTVTSWSATINGSSTGVTVRRQSSLSTTPEAMLYDSLPASLSGSYQGVGTSGTNSSSGTAGIAIFTLPATAQTLVPTGIGSAQAFGTPAVAHVGPQTVSPSGIASAQALGTANVTRLRPVTTLSPTGIGSAQAFGTATVTRGATTVHPVGIPGAETFGRSGIGDPFIIPAPTGTKPLPLMLVRRAGIRH